MTTMWDKAKGRRRQRIHLAARSLVESVGCEGLSMKRLADEAQVSLATVYNLIGTRDELLCRLVEAALTDVGVRLSQVGDHPAATTLVLGIDAGLTAAIDDEIYRTTTIGYALGHGCDGGFEGWRRRFGIEVESVLRLAIQNQELVAALAPPLLSRRIVAGVEHSLKRWARRRTDGPAFRAEVAYSTLVTLLAVASDRTWPDLVAWLQEEEAYILEA